MYHIEFDAVAIFRKEDSIMPVQPCTANGKSGYRWGEKGKCYTGEDAKKKAEKQGAAIKTSKVTTPSGIRAEGYSDWKPRKKRLDEAGKW